MSSFARISLLLSGALLAGCSFRMDPVENPVKLPVAWDAAGTTTGDAVPQDWWKRFDSPVLSQLVDEAMAGSPTLKIAQERVRQAERALSVARDDLLPDLSVNASTSRTRNGASGERTPATGETTMPGL